MSRRDFLGVSGGLVAAGAIGSVLPSSGCAPVEEISGSTRALSSTARIGIVGAGLAGLSCAYQLSSSGISVELFEANDRVGGRQWSLGGAFPGPVEFPQQVVERGGELIDNLHKTMLGWANAFGLEVENYHRDPGAIFYHFDGQLWPEEAIVDEYRELVAAMRTDLRSIGAPTALNHTESDREFDFMSLAEYLDTRGCGPLARHAIEEAYVAEYGLEIDRQSALSFLLFIHADRRSKWLPFGVFSDERYHVIGGNQQISEGLRARIPSEPQLGHWLVRATKTSDDRVALTFDAGGAAKSYTFDAVVFANPFSTLRDVDLSGLALPDWKLRTIDELQYGTNAKMMVGFDRRVWSELGSNGSAYSDLPSCQTVWETNWTMGTANRGVLTDYSGGDRGAALNPKKLQVECSRFLGDLERVYPGALAAASRDGAGKFVAHLEHWPSSPYAKGSYTANHPGYFTELADLEGMPVDNVYFAGEHANSFYEWQGFMEGAALSGLKAASDILAAIKGSRKK